jgi:hypothetical protein
MMTGEMMHDKWQECLFMETVIAMLTIIFNGLCAQKFEVVQIFSLLQKPVRTKLSVRKL